MKVKANKFLLMIDNLDGRKKELPQEALQIFETHNLKLTNAVHSDSDTLSATKTTFAKGFLQVMVALVNILVREKAEDRLGQLSSIDSGTFETAYSQLVYQGDELYFKYPVLSEFNVVLDSWGEGVLLGFIIAESCLKRDMIYTSRINTTMPQGDAVELQQQPDETFFAKQAAVKSEKNTSLAQIDAELSKEIGVSKMGRKDKFNKLQKKHAPKDVVQAIDPETLANQLFGYEKITENVIIELPEGDDTEHTVLWSIKPGTPLYLVLEIIQMLKIPVDGENTLLGFDEAKNPCMFIFC